MIENRLPLTADEENAVDHFISSETWHLIATNVIARGIDFKGINCVINFDSPYSASAYTHMIGICTFPRFMYQLSVLSRGFSDAVMVSNRYFDNIIGRFGRVGRSGEAITLYTEEDVPFLRNIANTMTSSSCEVPSWIMSLKKKK